MAAPTVRADSDERNVSLNDIQAARRTIDGLIHRTPLMGTQTLSNEVGSEVLLKVEILQKTGSFKARGALNACAHLTNEEKRHGVIAVSAGNHGAALAYGARRAGTQATVVMPRAASQSKIAAIEEYGARVELVDAGILMESMEAIKEAEGQTFIHPFDNRRVIAGAGTVAIEILEDAAEVDVIVVPVGGGGLLSGVVTAVKGLSPRTRVIGVEPQGSNVVSQSLAAGHPLRLQSFGSIADGLNAPWSGPLSLDIIRRLVDDMVTVNDSEIVHAMTLVMERVKLVVEPAGAAGIAALLTGKVDAGSRVVAIVSGGNVDVLRLGEMLSAPG